MELNKKVWDVTWTIHRCGETEGEHGRRRFRTFEGGKKKTQSVIADTLSKGDILPYLNRIRKGENSAYRNAMADFVEKLISNGAMFASKSDIPSLLPEDYPRDKRKQSSVLFDDAGNKIEDDEFDGDENRFKIKRNSTTKQLYFRYPHGADRRILTDIVLLDNPSINSHIYLKFEFYCDNKKLLRLNDIAQFSITFKSGIEYNKAKYSAQILEALKQSNEPITNTEIKRLTGIGDRKAIWRNIKKLQDAGFDIQQDDKHRYYLPKTKDVLSYYDMQIIKDSITLNPNITVEDKERLIELLEKI